MELSMNKNDNIDSDVVKAAMAVSGGSTFDLSLYKDGEIIKGLEFCVFIFTKSRVMLCVC